MTSKPPIINPPFGGFITGDGQWQGPGATRFLLNAVTGINSGMEAPLPAAPADGYKVTITDAITALTHTDDQPIVSAYSGNSSNRLFQIEQRTDDTIRAVMSHDTTATQSMTAPGTYPPGTVLNIELVVDYTIPEATLTVNGATTTLALTATGPNTTVAPFTIGRRALSQQAGLFWRGTVEQVSMLDLDDIPLVTADFNDPGLIGSLDGVNWLDGQGNTWTGLVGSAVVDTVTAIVDSVWNTAMWRGLVGTEGVRFKVEVAQVNLSHINRLSVGPGDDYFYNDPESDYDDAWYSLDDISWQDITSRVDRFSLSRGRDALATGFRPGTASITVHNDDGAFNPLRGRVIVGNQTLRPGRWIRFSGRRSTDIDQPFIPLWVGRIDTLGDTYQDAAFKSFSVWSCLDYMSALEQDRKPPLEEEDPTTPGQFTDERIRYIWDDILDNDPVFIETDPGTFTMKGTNFPGSKMNQITQAVKAEGGDFYVAKNGVMKFRNRTWLEDGPTPEGEVQFIIGTIADGHKVMDVKTSWDANRIRNYITMQREKRDEEDEPGRIIVTDSTSTAIYAARTFNETSLQNEFDTDVSENANSMLSQNAFDTLRIDEVTLWANSLESAQNLLRVELGWRVGITVQTGLGWSYAITAWVNGITHNVDAHGWSVALRLDNTDRSNPLLGGAFNDAFSTAFDLKETI